MSTSENERAATRPGSGQPIPTPSRLAIRFSTVAGAAITITDEGVVGIAKLLHQRLCTRLTRHHHGLDRRGSRAEPQDDKEHCEDLGDRARGQVVPEADRRERDDREVDRFHEGPVLQEDLDNHVSASGN